MSDYATVSSGNAEQDAETLRRFAISDDRIKSGNCPNGCGGMAVIDEHNAECQKCGFSYFASGGLCFPNVGRA